MKKKKKVEKQKTRGHLRLLFNHNKLADLFFSLFASHDLFFIFFALNCRNERRTMAQSNESLEYSCCDPLRVE